MLFKLINQDNNRQKLHHTIENHRVANAYIFHGPEGCGHEGFALEFAALLNCLSPDAKPCGTCLSCKKMRWLEHMNLELVFPIPRKKEATHEDPPLKGFSNAEIEEIQTAIRAKAENPYTKIQISGANVIPINFIREIKHNIYLSGSENGWKVVVVLDADLMKEEAANAFLKILEEPPPRSTIILTTTNYEAILPTIRSRCQPIFFPPLTDEHVGRFLTEQGCAAESIPLIIRLATGNIERALQLAQSDISEMKNLTLEIMRAAAVMHIEKTMLLVQQLAELQRKDEQKFDCIMSSLLFWIRDAVILREKADQPLTHPDLQTELRNFTTRFTGFDAQRIKFSVEKCIDFINRNVYINLALLNLFFELNQAINAGK